MEARACVARRYSNRRRNAASKDAERLNTVLIEGARKNREEIELPTGE
jgi:hypothetical protein